MLKKTIVAFSLLSFLAACGGPSATQGVTKRGESSEGLFGMSKSADVKVDTPKAFKGVNEVIIGSFVVGFGLKKTDSAKAGGGLFGSGYGGKSSANSTLTGVDDATMQQITEEVYAQFLKGLEAQGMKIADRNELLNSKEFKGTNTLANPHEESSGGIFGAKSITKYFGPKALGQISPFAGDIAGVIGGFGFSNPATGAAVYAGKSGKKVLHVVFVVDFANTEKYGSWATSSSSVSVGQGLSVIPGMTKIGIIGGEGGTFSTNIGTISLGQPTTSEKEFADVVDSTSDVAKTTEVVANVIGIIGGVGTNKSRDFEFKARPADFKAASIDAIQMADKAMLDKLATLRP